MDTHVHFSSQPARPTDLAIPPVEPTAHLWNGADAEQVRTQLLSWKGGMALTLYVVVWQIERTTRWHALPHELEILAPMLCVDRAKAWHVAPATNGSARLLHTCNMQPAHALVLNLNHPDAHHLQGMLFTYCAWVVQALGQCVQQHVEGAWMRCLLPAEWRTASLQHNHKTISHP